VARLAPAGTFVPNCRLVGQTMAIAPRLRPVWPSSPGSGWRLRRLHLIAHRRRHATRGISSIDFFFKKKQGKLAEWLSEHQPSADTGAV